jgi:hypothetical protein
MVPRDQGRPSSQVRPRTPQSAAVIPQQDNARPFGWRLRLFSKRWFTPSLPYPDSLQAKSSAYGVPVIPFGGVY